MPPQRNRFRVFTRMARAEPRERHFREDSCPLTFGKRLCPRRGIETVFQSCHSDPELGMAFRFKRRQKFEGVGLIAIADACRSRGRLSNVGPRHMEIEFGLALLRVVRLANSASTLRFWRPLPALIGK